MPCEEPFSQQPQPQGRASAAQAGSAASCPPGAGAAPASAGPNARKRKSAARSAKRHASRRARNRWNRCLTAVLCMVRLRLCVRRRVLEQDLREVGMLCDRSRSGSGQLVAQPVGMTGAKRLSGSTALPPPHPMVPHMRSRQTSTTSTRQSEGCRTHCLTDGCGALTRPAGLRTMSTRASSSGSGCIPAKAGSVQRSCAELVI